MIKAYFARFSRWLCRKAHGVHLRVEQHADREQTSDGSDTSPSDGEIPTLLERIKDFVGTVHDLPADASVNLDHYLYGTPKRQ
jgi:hypothetical protein